MVKFLINFTTRILGTELIEKLFKIFLILTGRNRIKKFYNLDSEFKIIYKYFIKKIDFFVDVGSFRGGIHF